MDSYIIGICGGSGSGKTSFINRLRSELNESQVTFISQDEYYHPREKQRVDDEGIKNFDLPDSIDNETLVSDIQSLLNGNSVIRKEYTFNNEQKEAEEIVYKPNRILIIEGLFIYTYSDLSKLIDLKIFIEAPENVKLIRRIRRDQMERNYPLEDVLYRYENHVMPSFQKYIQPHISECDLIVNNCQKYDNALEVLLAYIRSRLSE